MTEIKRYNGTDEFNKLLKTLTIVPANSEIVEKTGVSKGSISEIMNGKRTPTKNFIEKFKKGFNLEGVEAKNPSQNSEGNLTFNEHYEKILSQKDAFLELVLKDNERLRKRLDDIDDRKLKINK